MLTWLRCPSCRNELQLTEAGGPEIVDGALLCVACSQTYPIKRGIPRFTETEDYCSSFGMQWNEWGRLQLDRYNGTTISRDRFLDETGWRLEELKGKLVLDAGCGAGRFAQICADSGATVLAVDLSNSVEACQMNLHDYPNVHVAQADLLCLPFAPVSFDCVFCIGVIQHTPDPEKTLKTLLQFVRPGGEVAFWMYEKIPRILVQRSKYLLRLFTRRLSPETMRRWIVPWVNFWYPISRNLLNIPRVGPYLNYSLPVLCYKGKYSGLNEEQLKQWALLDTFDMFAPAHDHPQTWRTVRRWLEESGFDNITRNTRKALGVKARRRTIPRFGEDENQSRDITIVTSCGPNSRTRPET